MPPWMRFMMTYILFDMNLETFPFVQSLPPEWHRASVLGMYTIAFGLPAISTLAKLLCGWMFFKGKLSSPRWLCDLLTVLAKQIDTTLL